MTNDRQRDSEAGGVGPRLVFGDWIPRTVESALQFHFDDGGLGTRALRNVGWEAAETRLRIVGDRPGWVRLRWLVRGPERKAAP
jgi:hypothetical protein